MSVLQPVAADWPRRRRRRVEGRRVPLSRQQTRCLLSPRSRCVHTVQSASNVESSLVDETRLPSVNRELNRL